MTGPEDQRAEIAARWERAAAGWSRRADRVRELGMPVSVAMIDQLHLQPGHCVLELAAGPGDTGFLAAELVAPGGTLITSDASEPMLEVARERARALGVQNVEFRRLELEWIDLEAASVDGVLCRFGLMLIVDPDAALREIRRVLRPGGRLAIAVWSGPERNPWATIWNRPLVELGHVPPPDRNAPGMFALSHAPSVRERIEGAGFTDVVVESVEVPRSHPTFEHYLEEQLELSQMFGEVWARLSDGQRAEAAQRIAALAEEFRLPDGGYTFPAAALVAAAGA